MADEIKYRKVTELSVSDTLNDEDNVLIERNGSFMRVASDAFSDIETDAGLTREGAAADAKAVGEELLAIKEQIGAVSVCPTEEITAEEISEVFNSLSL